MELQLQELGRERRERLLIDEERTQIFRLRETERAILFDELAIRHAIGQRVLHREHRALHRLLVRNNRLRSTQTRDAVGRFRRAISDRLAETQTSGVIDEVAVSDVGVRTAEIAVEAEPRHARRQIELRESAVVGDRYADRRRVDRDERLLNRGSLRDRRLDRALEIGLKRRVTRDIRGHHVDFAADRKRWIVEKHLERVPRFAQAPPRFDDERLAALDRRDGVRVLRERCVKLAALRKHIAHFFADLHEPLGAHEARARRNQLPVRLLGFRHDVEQSSARCFTRGAIVVLREANLRERNVFAKAAQERLRHAEDHRTLPRRIGNVEIAVEVVDVIRRSGDTHRAARFERLVEPRVEVPIPLVRDVRNDGLGGSREENPDRRLIHAIPTEARAHNPIERGFRADDVLLGHRLFKPRRLHIEVVAHRGVDCLAQGEHHAARGFRRQRHDTLDRRTELRRLGPDRVEFRAPRREHAVDIRLATLDFGCGRSRKRVTLANRRRLDRLIDPLLQLIAVRRRERRATTNQPTPCKQDGEDKSRMAHRTTDRTRRTRLARRHGRGW